MQSKAAESAAARAADAEAKATEEAKHRFIAEHRLEDASTTLKQLQQKLDVKSKQLYDMKFERSGGKSLPSGA